MMIDAMREYLTNRRKPEERRGLPRPEKTPGPRRGPIIPKEAEAKRMRLNPTKAEAILRQSLAALAGGPTPFKTQVVLYGYIADQYCEEAKVVVEADGGYHNDEARAKADVYRDEVLASKGILTLRFKNEQVLQDPKRVLDEIHATVRQRYKALHGESTFHRQLVQKAMDEVNKDS